VHGLLVVQALRGQIVHEFDFVVGLFIMISRGGRPF